MSVPASQFSFNKGELSPALYGRIDTAGYHSGASTARNGFASYQGGFFSRPGTSFVGFSKQTGRSYPPRLINFQFSINQGLALEFGNEYMRVISNGDFVTETPIAITGVTQANPAVVSITASAGASATPVADSTTASYAPGDDITLAGGTYSAPAVLGVTNTTLQSVQVHAPGTVYIPGQTIVPAGGTQSTPAQLTITETQVVSATVHSAGSGGTNGTQTVTGTTGTGTKFTALVTVSGGGIAAVLSITLGGAYTANPSSLTDEPVTGASLSGAALSVVMGCYAVSVTGGGIFTANPVGATFTQTSTSGFGTGATFALAVMAPYAVTFVTAGTYSALPANPVAQASTTGLGFGATFDVSWTAAAPFANGDWVFITGVDGMTQLNGNTYVVAGATATTIQLHDVYGNNINSTAFGAYLSGGTGARIYTLTTPYSEVDLLWLKFVQSANVMSLCCRNQITGTEYAPMELERFADDNFSLIDYAVGASVDPPTGVAVASSGSGSTYFAYQVTSIDPSNGTESIASLIAAVQGVDIASTAGANTITWDAETGINNYNVYKAGEAAVPIPVGSAYGYMGTVAGTSMVDNNIVPDFQQVPPLAYNPFAPGAIIGAPVTASGSGLTTVTITVNTSTGSGAVLAGVIVNGTLADIVVLSSGQKYAPTDTLTISGGGAGKASGTITFAINPSASDTVTLNGDVWTFVSAVTGANQVQIGATLAATLTALAAQLNASADAELIVASYAASATVLTITYNTAGTSGNAYTLASFAATVSGPTLTGGGSSSSGAAAQITLGPASGVNPSVVGYYQERQVFGNSANQPDTYWMTQPGNFYDFDYRIPTIASDGITGSPWSLQVNGIQWFLSMPGGLLVFTGSQLWQLTGAGGSGLTPVAITPSDQQAQPQVFNGCSATLPPQQIGATVLFADAVGSNVYDITYQYFYNIYTGTDITVYSSHLFDNFSLDQWAWCRQPNKLQWGVRSDGAALSLAYIKEQDVVGWTRHDTQGLFVSVCSVIEPPVNAPYFAVQRFLANGTAFTIERMDNRLWTTAETCWCVDCGLASAHVYPSATVTASSATGLGALTGVVNLVGGSGYSGATTAVVVDDNGNGPGSRAEASITISNGVITSVTFPREGRNYVYPNLFFVDPAGTGMGASADPVLDNAATLTAGAAVFSAGNVGSVVRMGGGVMTITGYTDTEHVTVNITSPILQVIPNSGWVQQTDSGDWVLVSTVPLPQASGNWTMDAPISEVVNLDYLAGMYVTGLADGGVIPPTLVSASGTIPLPAPATQIIVGLGFQVQLQSPYLPEPTVQGQRKRISRVTARMQSSGSFKIGSNQPDASTLPGAPLTAQWSNLADAEPADVVPPLLPPYGGTILPLFTGDIRIPIKGGFAKPGQVALQQDQPLPLNVLCLLPEIDEGDLPEGAKSPQKQPQQQQQAPQRGGPPGLPWLVR
jgi:hypothetical protein